MRKSLILIPVLVCLLAGCEEKARKAHETPVTRAAKAAAGLPMEDAKKIVTRYNQLLAQGYRDLDMTPLQEVATRDLAMKAYYHMAALGEGKARMNSRLKRLDFVSIETSGTTPCHMQTREVWDFAHKDIVSGKLRQEVRDYVYVVHYMLENRKGTWLITRISAIGEEDLKNVPKWDRMLAPAD